MTKEGIVIIKCESCGAPLEAEEGKPVGFCQYCGAKYDVSSITKEDKDVELAKINNQAYIESEKAKQKHELEKLRQEKEWQQKQQSLEEDKEKREAFKKGKFKGALIIFTIIFGLGAFLSLIMGYPFSTVIAFVQIGLVIFAWLAASRTVKIKFPAAHIIAFIVALVLIFPYFNVFGSNFGELPESKYEKFEWKDIALCEILPQPPSDMGKIYSNTEKDLNIHIANISDSQYNNYKRSCKEKGFNIDDDEINGYFAAYNEEGYKINLSYFDKSSEMSLLLEPPIEMKTIEWPSSTVGKILPAPKSDKGKFSYEYEDHFLVYIGNTSIDDYDDYVKTCSEKGFTVDYQKGDDYYDAHNRDGYKLSLRYIGNNVMTVEISAPEEETQAETKAEVTETESKVTAPAEQGSEISMPFSSTAFISKNYQDVVQQLKNAGFTNIETVPADDMIVGFLHDEGDVKEVSVNGETSFLSNDKFPANAEIIVTYHSYPPESLTTSTVTEKPQETEPPVALNSAIRPDFKEAMDSYEAFMDEYVEFMKKYKNADAMDMLGMLSQYTDFMQKYSDFSDKMDKWESDMNDAELTYYLEVTARVNKKLLEMT